MLAVIRGRGLLPSPVPPCGVCQCCPHRDFFFLAPEGRQALRGGVICCLSLMSLIFKSLINARCQPGR